MMKEAIQGGPEGLWEVLRTSAGYSKGPTGLYLRG